MREVKKDFVCFMALYVLLLNEKPSFKMIFFIKIIQEWKKETS